MRVPIWVQLALLVSGVALLALTVVAVPTWVYVQNFVINVETDSLALAASLYATKIDSQLQLLNTISRTVSTRILIQQSLVNYYNGNATTKDPFEPTVTDLQSALATSSFTGLLQARIYSRNQTGENSTGLVSVTGSGVGTQTENIRLPYLTPDGLPVNLSDTEFGYPPSLYPNITYVNLDYPNPYIPTEKAVAASAFPDVLLSDSRGLLLGPLAINQTFALISLTIPIRSLQSGFILGYLTLVAAANSFLDIQTAIDGLGSTGVALLVTPDDPSNRFTPPLLPSNATYQPPRDSLSNYPVRIVLAPAMHTGQVDRHTDKQGIWNTPFPLSRYPTIGGAYATWNGKLSNARASLTTTNEQGYAVAVGVARPQTTLVDWVIVVEKARDEAYRPISLLRKILIGCAFGTAGLVMLLIIPCAYFSVRPIRRLKTATEKSITVPGYDLQYSDDEKNAAASAGGTLSSASIKSLFQSIKRKFSKPQRPLTQAEIENHRRVFKIPGRVKERAHIITDEVTELTEVYNKMTDELVRQYTSLDDQVAKRTKELEISKKAAEAANESKTLFIANISHELKTPLNGIMGICAVCMEENDILHIQHSLKTLYRSGELLLHLLDDLLSFSKNQISHEIKLERKEFRLGEIRSQVISIFEKQARESKIDLEVIFSGRSSENLNPPRLLVQHGPRASQLHRVRDMYILGDQHRILQVIINLVSNSLKFTSAGGKVQVRIHWGDNVVPRHEARPAAGSHTQSESSNDETGSLFKALSKATTPALQPVANPLEQRGRSSDPHVVFDEETQSSLTQTTESANEYLFTFEVEDTGRGIPINMQDKIFEPFVQVDSSFSKEFGGTGLGLSICSQLANLMGGTITVKSSEGLGSTFSLQIPLKHIIDRVPSTRSDSTRPRSRAPSAGGSTTGGGAGSGHRNSLSSVLAQDAETTTTTNADNHRSDIQPRLVGLSTPFFPPNPTTQAASAAAATATVVPPSTSVQTQAAIQKAKADKAKDPNHPSASSDLCVLVADDNATNIEVVRRMLKLEKVLDVTIAKDGREAYELVKANMERGRKFDLIFMDVQMPNLDGIQSTKLIRQMGYAAPIVALTAFSEESNRKECMESGMDEFLAKPIRRSALKSVLTKFATIDEESV